jgi:hypothetical protein
MKTTIDIPDALYRKAKIRAVEQGATLKDIVLGALTRDLQAPAQKATPQKTYWSKRKLTPEYQKALEKGSLKSVFDSAEAVSDERDAR